MERLKKGESTQMTNKEDINSEETNEELRDILTHQAGSTDLHKTRHTDKPVQIDPPIAGSGIIDSREDRFKTKKH
jgi:hypothetical protein